MLPQVLLEILGLQKRRASDLEGLYCTEIPQLTRSEVDVSFPLLGGAYGLQNEENSSASGEQTRLHLLSGTASFLGSSRRRAASPERRTPLDV